MSNAIAPIQIVRRQVVNVTDQPITLQFAEGPNQVSLVTFAPGVPVEVPSAYATPQAIAPNRDPKPSVIDMLSNGRVLDISDKRAAAVRQKLEAAEAKAKAR